MDEKYNVSSAVIFCKSEDVENLKKEVEKIKGVEAHFSDVENGKFVITIESSCIDEEIKSLKEVEKIQGIVSAQMIYSYHSDELASLRENISTNNDVISMLNDDKVKAQDIVYGDSVQDKINEILK